MQKKNGISLIVLVITIIVMVILAAAIIISLTNSGIIGKANTAVEQSNLKQVQQIASLAWAEAYADGKTSEAELKSAVDTALVANKVDTSKYNVKVTESGVTVATKGENSESDLWYDGWEVAYLYIDGTWQTLVASEAEGIEEVTNADMAEAMAAVQTFARFYKTGETLAEKLRFPAGDAYKLVVSGSGEMGELATDANLTNTYAWFNEFELYITGQSDKLPKIVYTTEIIVEEGVTSIASGAFYGVSNCQSITIPSTVTSIEEDAIIEPAGNIIVSNNNQNYIVENNILYNKAKTQLLCASTSIESANLPESLVTIESMAFVSCDKLKSILIPAGVEVIEDDTFSGCESLADVTILCKKLESYSFPNCDNLKTITISKNLEEMSDGAFGGCDNIETINYEGTAEEWAALIGSNNTELESATVNYNYTINY